MITWPKYLAKALLLGSVLSLSSSTLFALRIQAQSQDDQSVAEAARKAREKKKTPPKDGRVITDETLNLRPASADSGSAPPAGTVINTTPVMPGQPASAPGDNAAKNSGENVAPASTPAAETGAPAADSQKEEKQKAEIARLKETLKQLQSELDLLKRQLVLDSETFYSQPDYAHNSEGKAKLDQLQRQIGDKKASLDDFKQQLEQLMQEAGISADAADKSSALPQN